MAHRPATSAALTALDTMAALFRRSPTSLPRLKGKVLTGTVQPGPPGATKFVDIDVGFKANVTLLRAELAPGCDPDTPFGRAALAAATAAGTRHQLVVEHVATPLGEMALDADRAREATRGEGVWREIEAAHAAGTVIQGRLLNAVNKGFAVGVGGLVAFLPDRMIPYAGLPPVGALHPYYVVSIVPETRNVVLAGALPARIAAALKASRDRPDRTPRFSVVKAAQAAAAREAQRAAVREAEVMAAGATASEGKGEDMKGVRRVQVGNTERDAAATERRAGRRAELDAAREARQVQKAADATSPLRAHSADGRPRRELKVRAVKAGHAGDGLPEEEAAGAFQPAVRRPRGLAGRAGDKDKVAPPA